MVKVIRSQLGDLPTVLEDTFLISSNPRARFRQTLIMITNAIMSLTCAVSIYFLGLERSLEGSANFAVLTVTNAIKHIIYYFRKNEVRELLNVTVKLQEEHKKEWERKMFEDGSNDAWNDVHKFSVILTCYVIFVLALPSILDFVIGIFFPDAISIGVHLPCEGLMDFLGPRSLERFVFTVVVLLWCFEAITIDIGTESLTFIPIMYTKIELRIIINKLLIIKNLMNEREISYRDETEKLLREVISQHQRILEILNSMSKTLGLPLAIHNSTFAITLCFSFYCIITIDESGSMAAKVQGTSAIIIIGSLLCALCYFGEQLETENQELLKAIYDLPWYNQNLNFRRAVLVMIRQSQKPLVINYRLISNLNLQTFMQIINKTYSYLMMLKSTV
ncbi:odorant receptor 4-like [Halyomorpha halys]|uniref:odorant receptor 4-like n=1 Tax=Halyomorpha halys TaxID=286706 RepID=UPI0034D26734|nr:Odorant receptor 75 [Halyomorpha halys]